jgi:hypothetical protein
MIECWTEATEKNVGCCLLRDDIIRAKIDFIPARTRATAPSAWLFEPFDYKLLLGA